jgi:hypothetical protein
MGKRYYDDRDFYAGDEMLTAASSCSRFERRRDVNSFNMTDYQSCENCRHLTADSRCAVRMDTVIPRQTLLNEKP